MEPDSETKTPQFDNDMLGSFIDHGAALQRAVTMMEHWLVTLTLAVFLIGGATAMLVWRAREAD